jgi:glucosylceramidase
MLVLFAILSFLSLPILATSNLPHSVSVVRTSLGSNERLTPGPNLTFSGSPHSTSFLSSTNISITIDSLKTFQTIFGFGGAITESAVHVFEQLASADQIQILQDLFGENNDNTSLRYTTGRLTIGSCDYSLGYYSYNDKVNDTTMSNFTIAHDEVSIIPFILSSQTFAKNQNRSLRFISTPWSPPGWMKSNGLMSCFPLGPLDCSLLSWAQPSYALYFSKYLTAYKAAGVNIWGITVQNEPQPQTGTLTYEGMWFPFTTELEFVSQHLGPQLRNDHPDIKILIFDHNMGPEMILYALPILSDVNSSQYVDGVAFHWYDGPDWNSIEELHSLFPNVTYLATEATAGRGPQGTSWWLPNTTVGSDWWSTGEFYGTYIMNDLLSFASGFIDWNILLDQNGGPDHGDPTGELCEGLIPCGSDAMLIADVRMSPPVVYRQAFYYFMGHFSRFVPPDSVRIQCTVQAGNGGKDGNLTAVSFTTPSGSTVLVVMNTFNIDQTVSVVDSRYGLVTSTIQAHSIESWIW